MALKLSVRYRSEGDLAHHLKELVDQGALLLPLSEQVDTIQQYQALELQIDLADTQTTVAAEVLQVIPSLGLVARLESTAALLGMVGDTSPSDPADPPVISILSADDGSTADTRVQDDGETSCAGPVGRPGTSALSWPIERLQAEWHNLTVPEKVRVARYGKRPARGFILKQQDKVMHNHLLANAKITPEEVAVMASMINLDAALLKRIASSQEWLRHTAVARNLTCHPKLSLPQVTKAIEYLSGDELRRLTRTGKVRASVKRLIIKKLEQREGRR